MIRKVIVGALLLMMLAAPGFAETGIGLSVGYPVWTIIAHDLEFETRTLFVGANVRWKPSVLQLEAGLSKWMLPDSKITSIYGDAGICFDLWVIRVTLAGGFDAVHFGDIGWGTYTDVGLNAKANLDVKIGPVSVGANILVPFDIFGLPEPYYDPRVFSAQAMVNVLYWFETGPKRP